MKRIFIMSSERSGSNLVRKILGRHPRGIAPMAIHFPTNLEKLSPLYIQGGEFRSDDLVTDMLYLARHHIVPWEYDIDVNVVKENIRTENFWGCMVAVYDTLARIAGKQFWVCKDNGLFNYANRILENFPEARFIYLVRDGRDVALSFMEMTGGPGTITDAARLWSSEQQVCLQICKACPDNVITVRYEDLLGSPENTTIRMCEFIGIPYTVDMLDYFRSDNGAAEKSRFWSNLDKPILRDNFNKWKKHMTIADACYYQTVSAGEAGRLLARLGYEVLEEKRASLFYIKIKPLLDTILGPVQFLQGKLDIKEQQVSKDKKMALQEIKRRLSGN